MLMVLQICKENLFKINKKLKKKKKTLQMNFINKIFKLHEIFK